MQAPFNKTTPLIRLFKLIEFERNDLVILPIIIFGYGLLNFIIPISVQALVNIVSMGAVLQPLFIISIVLFVLLALSGSLYVFEIYVVELIQRRLFIRTAINAAEKTSGIDIGFYDQENPVELVNRFLDITTVQKTVSSLLTVALIAFLQAILGSLILIFYSAYFAILVFVILGFLAFIFYGLGRHAEETALAESKTKYQMISWLENIARNIFTFKFYDTSDRGAHETHSLVNKYIEKRSSHFTILLWQNISACIIYAAGGTALLALGGSLVIRGEINIGQFVAAELIIFGVLGSVMRFVNKLSDFYDLLAALDKIGVIEDFPQESNGELILDQPIQHLNINGISFAYHPRVQVLPLLSFQLSQGQSMAILGNPGSGKSTLINLLAKIRQPDSGFVEINHLDIRQLDNYSLRNRIGYVSHLEIIEGSIIDNIRLGRDISLTRINQLINEIEIGDEFRALPNGLDTELSASGAPLSTSQLQRLMIIRGMAGAPGLFMIDGMLDNFNDEKLRQVIVLLKSHQKDFILIVSTRFPHIAKHFDQIIDLNKLKA
jgi:ABC-type bacteriocin/lantibiotic exporter with double-glycine peptidase domain